MFAHVVKEKFWRKRITIVVPDYTRSLDYEKTLLPLVAFLSEQEAEINFYVALGLHRQMTDEELVDLQSIADAIGAKVKQHRARSGALVEGEGLVSFHRRYILGVDLLINVGVVEPHQYAGFSGGVKGLAIGCADAISIAQMHHPFHLKSEGVGVGKLTDNIFQENLWKAVVGLPDIFGLFSVKGSESIYFDRAEVAFSKAVREARKVQFREIPKRVKWMDVKVPPSKSKNFYQASRAATYLALVENSGLEYGGHILLNAPCPEGIGQGEGEKACAKLMRRGVEALLEKLEKCSEDSPSVGGEQRAFVIAQAMARSKISLIGAPPIDELAAMGIRQFSTLEEAKEFFELKEEEGLFVEDPFLCIPIWADIAQH